MGFGDSDHVLGDLDIWLQDYASRAPEPPAYSDRFLNACERFGLTPYTLLPLDIGAAN